MHDSTANLKTEMYNAGYLDGLQDHTPHPNPTEPACYAVGYDNGFMERYGFTWTDDLGEE